MDERSLQLDFTTILDEISIQGTLAYCFAIFMSIFFAIIITFIYEIVFSSGGKGIQVNKSFVILAPGVTAIFLVIQFSLPLSLGLLGALSFVRFRTPIKEPEEIGFILIIISSSLCCAVYKFEIAFILVAVTFFTVLIRDISYLKDKLKFLFKRDNLELVISHSAVSNNDVFSIITKKLSHDAYKLNLLSVSEVENARNYHIRILGNRRKTLDIMDITKKISSIPEIKSFNMLT